MRIVLGLLEDQEQIRIVLGRGSKSHACPRRNPKLPMPHLQPFIDEVSVLEMAKLKPWPLDGDGYIIVCAFFTFVLGHEILDFAGFTSTCG